MWGIVVALTYFWSFKGRKRALELLHREAVQIEAYKTPEVNVAVIVDHIAKVSNIPALLQPEEPQMQERHLHFPCALERVVYEHIERLSPLALRSIMLDCMLRTRRKAYTSIIFEVNALPYVLDAPDSSPRIVRGDNVVEAPVQVKEDARSQREEVGLTVYLKATACKRFSHR